PVFGHGQWGHRRDPVRGRRLLYGGDELSRRGGVASSTPLSPDRRAMITVHTASAATLTAVRAMSSRRSSTSSTPMASVGNPTAARITAMPTRDAAGMLAMPMLVS